MPRTSSKAKPAAAPPPPPAGSAAPTIGASSMAPSGQFSRRQEGQRFLARLNSIAPSPRNLREEWEYATDEFAEFTKNVQNTDLIQDPAVSSVDAYTERYPEYAGTFGPDVEWVLLAGERRYRAALENSEPTDSIAVVLRDKLLDKGDFVLLSENTFRKGWDPIQEAQLLERIRREEGLSYDEILERLGGQHSRIKRRGDISKRIKLLELQDGPLRQAIRQGDILLEPAYTLVSKLVEPALIEQGWVMMQAQGLTARVVCDILLGKAPAASPGSPPGSSTEQADRAAPAASSPVLNEAGRSSSAGEHPGGVDGREPATASFVDETSGTGGAIVPTQPGARNGLTQDDEAGAGVASPGSTPADHSTFQQEEEALRLTACTTVLSSLTWPDLDEVTRTVAAHVLLEASSAAFTLALRISGTTGPKTADRAEYVAALDAAADSGPLRMAYAVALATDELHLRSVGERLDPRAVDYLKRLHETANYDTAGYRTGPVAISSTKL